MKKMIMPYIARIISSNQLKDIKRASYQFNRIIKGRESRVDIFLRIDDPYSYLLIQVIEDFLVRFRIKAEFHVVLELQEEMFPAMDMWHQYASRDAGYLADLYQLDFPSKQVVIDDRNILEAATAELLLAESSETFISTAKDIFKRVWSGEFTDQLPQEPFENNQLKKQLIKNQLLLEKKGHYFGAMINFEGEWYWGVDRLDHLESRLIKQGLALNKNDNVQFNLTYNDFCKRPIEDVKICDVPLTIYWSARSPYSYIGLVQAIKLSEYYGIPLIIKPVLPMMMRGMNVPQAKKMYIFMDTKREAQKLSLPYGYVADPLGPAVERCYALLEYARNENKLQEFLLSFAKGVNTQGIRGETDSGMRIMVERCGLNWLIAKDKINNTDWKAEVNRNLDDMFKKGCWGVPSFEYGDHTLWGQDRMGIIENLIRNN
ncbi:MAG: DsbA family protein [Bermanella sp.]